MSSIYRFHKPPERQASFGPLEEGDYSFIVSECGQPYEKNNKIIIEVKLSIQPDGVPVWAIRGLVGTRTAMIATGSLNLSSQ